jgi:hypothetical protein
MDIKDNNNDLPIHDPFNWKSLGFFSAEDYLIYVFKKAEKITAAIYLVSGLLKDEEPVKWELRDRGMELLTSSFTASSSLPGDKNIVIQSLFTAALETISLLNVAKISNLVSEMNHRLLVREIDSILSLLRDKLTANVENAGYILSDAFFKTPNLFSTDFKSVPGAGSVGSSQSLSKDKDARQTSFGDKSQITATNKAIHKGHADVQEKKNERQEMIISALKGQADLTIKDFSKIIKDCSEKTIQRELLHMVEVGLIKKEGERRWSRYSLK